MDAGAEAAEIRLRPVLMTAFAFILGVRAARDRERRRRRGAPSLGTAVFGGMLVATVLSLVLVPALYVVIERLRERFGAAPVEAPAAPGPAAPAPGGNGD